MAPTLKTKEKITGIGVRKGVQKFSLDGDYYDQSTYVGRFLGFIDVIDPQTLFVSDEEITASQQLLKNFSDGSRVVNDDQMWAAKKIVNATIHPSTQEKGERGAGGRRSGRRSEATTVDGQWLRTGEGKAASSVAPFYTMS